MRTRTFRGQEITSLMTQIKEEVGDDALIVSMHETNGQFEIEVGMAKNQAEVRGSEPVIQLREPIQGSSKQKLLSKKEQLESVLSEHGVHPLLSTEITKEAEKSFGTEMSADRYIGLGLESLIECNSLLPWKQKTVALCGATGVGKTTTIAKLAARLRQSFDISIGLIAADTYRVGAGYHLQTYASLMNLPFKQIEGSGKKGATALKKAVDAFSKYDLILIDTAGCGPREKGRIEELELSLSLIPDAERILVLPAPSNDFDLHAAAASFEKVNYSRVILTKVDESGFIGPVVNTIIHLEKPLAFITSGQRVPEDIEPASNRRLGWMLTRSLQ